LHGPGHIKSQQFIDNLRRDRKPIPNLRAHVSGLGAGTRANYRVTSAEGHVVSGSWPFQVTTAGTGHPGPPAAAPAASGGIPVWPFVALGAVLVAGGAWWALRGRRPRSG